MGIRKNAKKQDYINNVAKRISDIATEKKLRQTQIAEMLSEIGYVTTQPTINRYFNGENEPSAAFIKAFCQSFDLSSDYVLGLNDLATSPKKVTPFVVLNNLVLLLNQFDFDIEFNDNHSKAMLTTDNEFMINFLSLIKKAEQFSTEQIECFCKDFDLAWHDKSFKTKEKYYSYYRSLFADMKCISTRESLDEEYGGHNWVELVTNPLKEELGIDLLTPLSLKELYEKQWDQFLPNEKDKIIKEIEEELSKEPVK